MWCLRAFKYVAFALLNTPLLSRLSANSASRFSILCLSSSVISTYYHHKYKNCSLISDLFLQHQRELPSQPLQRLIVFSLHSQTNERRRIRNADKNPAVWKVHSDAVHRCDILVFFLEFPSQIFDYYELLFVVAFAIDPIETIV